MKTAHIKATNEVATASWNRVKPTHRPNTTKNSVITQAMFKRECEEYDAGVLPFEHELYIGERV